MGSKPVCSQFLPLRIARFAKKSMPPTSLAPSSSPRKRMWSSPPFPLRLEHAGEKRANKVQADLLPSELMAAKASPSRGEACQPFLGRVLAHLDSDWSPCIFPFASQSLLPVWVPTVRRGPPEKPGMVPGIMMRCPEMLENSLPECIAIVVAHPSTASATGARATVLSKKTANALLRHLHIGNSVTPQTECSVEGRNFPFTLSQPTMSLNNCNTESIKLLIHCIILQRKYMRKMGDAQGGEIENWSLSAQTPPPDLKGRFGRSQLDLNQSFLIISDRSAVLCDQDGVLPAASADNRPRFGGTHRVRDDCKCGRTNLGDGAPAGRTLFRLRSWKI